MPRQSTAFGVNGSSLLCHQHFRLLLVFLRLLRLFALILTLLAIDDFLVEQDKVTTIPSTHSHSQDFSDDTAVDSRGRIDRRSGNLTLDLSAKSADEDDIDPELSRKIAEQVMTTSKPCDSRPRHSGSLPGARMPSSPSQLLL